MENYSWGDPGKHCRSGRPQQRTEGNMPLFAVPVKTQGRGSQAATGPHCPGKGGNRWRFNRNLIALFGVGQEVSSGGPGGKLSAKSHTPLREGACCGHFRPPSALGRAQRGWECEGRHRCLLPVLPEPPVCVRACVRVGRTAGIVKTDNRNSTGAGVPRMGNALARGV